MSDPTQIAKMSGKDARAAFMRLTANRVLDLVRIGVGFSESSEATEELVTAYECCRSIGGAEFADLLLSPYLLGRVVRAEHLITSGTTVSGAVAQSIEEVWFPLALASAMRGGFAFSCDVNASSPRALDLPGRLGCLLLPATARNRTRVSVDESGLIRIDGFPAAVAQPLTCGPFQILPRDCGLPIEGMPGQVPLGPTELPEHGFDDAVSKALAIVDTDQEASDLVRSLVGAIVPLRSSSEPQHLSSSIRDLPGVVAMDLNGHVVDIAEALVHEADHQRYYIQSELAPFWASDSDRRAIYRSPWRPDPRPLDGLLAGASAFSAIGTFFANVVSLSRGDQIAGRSIGLRAIHASLQALRALEVVDRFAAPTTMGRSIVAQCAERAHHSLSTMGTHQNYEQWHRKATERLVEHDSAWSQEHGTDGDRLERVAAVP